MEKLQRSYVIPLRRDFVKVPRYYRAKRAISYIKKFISKHMKEEDVRLGKHLNEYVWSRGITNPPGKVKVEVIKEENFVSVELEGKKYEVQSVQKEPTKEETFKDKLTGMAKGKEEPEEDSKPEEPKKEEKPKKEDKSEKKAETKDAKKEK